MALCYVLSSQSPVTAVPAAEYMKYIVTNTSLLPGGVADSLIRLEAEWKEGDLTRRGYLKRRSQLLVDYHHLSATNGSVVFGPGREGVEQVGGATRRLLSVSEEATELLVKERSLQSDIARAVVEWEHMHGPWVSAAEFITVH